MGCCRRERREDCRCEGCLGLMVFTCLPLPVTFEIEKEETRNNPCTWTLFGGRIYRCKHSRTQTNGIVLGHYRHQPPSPES